MKHWSLFVLAYLLNGDMALGSKLPANCATTTVLSVITTTMCSAGSPAVPTTLMTSGNGNVPDHYSQPASGPSAVDSGSIPHFSMSHESADSPSAGTYGNPPKESGGLQSGAGAHIGDSNGTTEAVKPHQTTAPGLGASASSSSEAEAHVSGHASSATGQDSTATGATSKNSETPGAPETVSGASRSAINIELNVMIVAGIAACLAPMMVHL